MSREIAEHLLANGANVAGALDAGSYIALASNYLALERRLAETERELNDTRAAAAIEGREADKAREKLKTAVEALNAIAKWDADYISAKRAREALAEIEKLP